MSIVRVTDVEINHLKNVRKGSFKTNSRFAHLKKADVVGFYGQNGSGKTAVVDAFNLLKTLLSASQPQYLPKVTDNLIYFNEEAIHLTFQFIVSNHLGEYFVKYSVSLGVGRNRLKVVAEEMAYRENKKNKRFKNLISKAQDDILIRNKPIAEMNESVGVTVSVANKMAAGKSTSFVFREELMDAYQFYFDEQELEIFKNLAIDFNRDLHVIDTVQYGLHIANIIMPFSSGHIPYEMKDAMVLPTALFHTLEKVVKQTNIVLKTIIPGLQVRIRQINTQKLADESEGVHFEFLSKKGEVELPLRSESEGILKVISILSTLIVVYNKPNACVIIDELDAGVFEYLLGELLEVLSEYGQGQLLFTSHNLRILEVLPIRNLWFTTLNEEDRYLQLRGVKKFSNARDIYLRAVQLGGQSEAVYDETDLYDIKKSFRKAGIANDEK